MSRLDSNREIIKLLTEAVEKYPSLRFGQMLTSFDVITINRDPDGCVVSWKDEYNTESCEILERLRKALQQLDIGLSA